MPTKATRDSCGPEVLISRPCRQDRRTRLFTPKKLEQVIDRVCDEFGKDETKAAIVKAMEAHGCYDEEECEEEKEECKRAKQALEDVLEAAQLRLAALAAAIALALTALGSGDEERAQEVLDQIDDHQIWPWWVRIFGGYLLDSGDPEKIARAERAVEFWGGLFDWLGELLGPDQEAAGQCLTDLDAGQPIPQQITERQGREVELGEADRSLIDEIMATLKKFTEYARG